MSKKCGISDKRSIFAKLFVNVSVIMNKISKEEFLRRIQSINFATSVNGVKYTSIQVNRNRCTGLRKTQISHLRLI